MCCSDTCRLVFTSVRLILVFGFYMNAIRVMIYMIVKPKGTVAPLATSALMWMTFWSVVTRLASSGLMPRFKWSPWGFSSFKRCGVQIREEPDFSYTLDHSSFCESIDQITFKARPDHEPVSEEEMSQLRGAPGACSGVRTKQDHICLHVWANCKVK